MKHYTAVLALVAVFCQPVLAADPVQASIDWLLSLKLTDMPPQDEPFVRVVTGMTQREGQPSEVHYSLAFLESDDGTHYRAHYFNSLRLDEDRGGAAKYGDSVQDEVQRLTGVEAVSFWCDRLEEFLKPYPLPQTHGVFLPAGEIIYLSAVLQSRGEFDAAETLVSRAKAMFPQAWPKDEEFPDVAKKQIVESLWHSAIRGFIDPKVSWKELGARLSEIVQHFPGSKTAEEAETMLGPMRKAIEQEELIAKSGLDDKAIDRLPVRDRVAALIQRLSNQDGRQWSTPGYCDVFLNDYGVHFWMGSSRDHLPQRATTPAGKLFELGWDAVPQLIEAIEDPRPTRAAGMGAHDGHASALLDVGDCACQILERIAGRRFGQQDAKREAQEWWESVKNTSEADLLEKKVGESTRGTSELNIAAQRLAVIAPDRLVAMVEKGLWDKADSYCQTDVLLPALVAANGQSARTLMCRLVSEGQWPDVRVRAARFVTKGEWEFNGRPIPAYPEGEQQRAREAMFKTWESAVHAKDIDGSYAPGELPDLLGTWMAEDISRLKSIRKGYAGHSLELRRVLMHIMVERFKQPGADALAAHGADLEDFLGEQLDDVSYSYHIAHGKTANLEGRIARMGDMAAELLHRVWPGRYAFTWDASPRQIEEARKQCLETWRSGRQLPPAQPEAPVSSDRTNRTAVRGITLAKGSRPLPLELQTQADVMVGRPLNSHELVQFLVDFAAANPDDNHSIRLTAKRATQASQFDVELMIRHELSAFRKSNCRSDVSADGKSILDVTDRMDHRAALNPESLAYSSFRWRVEEALRGSGDGEMYFQFVRYGQPSVKR